MAVKAPAKDPAAAALDAIRFISAARNPANTPLPGGTVADPTYLAFLRGAGFSQQDAQAQAIKQVADARAAYATQSQRLPEQLAVARENTDATYGATGDFASGERLVQQNRNTVANQQAGQDLLSTATGAYGSAESGLQGTLANLARQQADAVGGLQDRAQQHADQNRYIAAVAGARSGGGGGVTINLPNPPPTPGATPAATVANGPPAPVAPLLGAGQQINDYLSSQPLFSYLGQLNNNDQANWLKFVTTQHPGADFSPALTAIGQIQAQRANPQSQNQQGLRSGGPGQAY